MDFFLKLAGLALGRAKIVEPLITPLFALGSPAGDVSATGYAGNHLQEAAPALSAPAPVSQAPHGLPAVPAPPRNLAERQMARHSQPAGSTLQASGRREEIRTVHRTGPAASPVHAPDSPPDPGEKPGRVLAGPFSGPEPSIEPDVEGSAQAIQHLAAPGAISGAEDNGHSGRVFSGRMSVRPISASEYRRGRKSRPFSEAPESGEALVKRPGRIPLGQFEGAVAGGSMPDLEQPNAGGFQTPEPKKSIVEPFDGAAMSEWPDFSARRGIASDGKANPFRDAEMFAPNDSGQPLNRPLWAGPGMMTGINAPCILVQPVTPETTPVKVTIGRVEIEAASPPVPPKASARHRRRAGVTLDEYLSKRNGGRS